MWPLCKELPGIMTIQRGSLLNKGVWYKRLPTAVTQMGHVQCAVTGRPWQTIAASAVGAARVATRLVAAGLFDLLGRVMLDAWLALLLMARELDAAGIAEGLGTSRACAPERGVCGATLQASLNPARHVIILSGCSHSCMPGAGSVMPVLPGGGLMMVLMMGRMPGAWGCT